MTETTARPRVAVVGPVPPPIHGHMILTERVLKSRRLADQFELVHVDESDHRPLHTIGRFDLTNISLAVQHSLGMMRVLASERPSLVHLPLAQNRLGLLRDFSLLVPALVARSRVIVYVLGGGFGQFLESSPRWFRLPARALLQRCSRIVVMSEWQKPSIESLFPGVPVDVVRPGTPAFQAPDRVAHRGPLRVLFASSFQESKGLFDAIEAAAVAEKRDIPLRWTFVGAWLTARERERALAVTSKLRSVTFVERLERGGYTSSYADADVLVFPPHPVEAFGLVRIEAMSAGLPVITTEAGGAREIIRDGVDGFIVDYGAPDQIVDRLARLQADPELSIAMGKVAKERQRELFNEEAFESALAEAWAGALNGDRAR